MAQPEPRQEAGNIHGSGDAGRQSGTQGRAHATERRDGTCAKDDPHDAPESGDKPESMTGR